MCYLNNRAPSPPQLAHHSRSGGHECMEFIILVKTSSLIQDRELRKRQKINTFSPLWPLKSRANTGYALFFTKELKGNFHLNP